MIDDIWRKRFLTKVNEREDTQYADSGATNEIYYDEKNHDELNDLLFHVELPFCVYVGNF